MHPTTGSSRIELRAALQLGEGKADADVQISTVSVN